MDGELFDGSASFVAPLRDVAAAASSERSLASGAVMRGRLEVALTALGTDMTG